MAKVTNAFTTYNAQANREDLSNAIYNIDPFDTPVMSAIRRRNVKNRIFDWQTEFLPLVNLTNAQFEGFQLSNGPSSRPSAATTSRRSPSATPPSQARRRRATRRARAREMAHQMALAAKVLKSDMESILCSRQQRVDGDVAQATAPRTTEAFAHWLGRAVDKNSNPAAAVAPGTVTTGLPTAQGSLPGDAAFAAPGTPVSITEPCSATRCSRPTPTAARPRCGSSRRARSGPSPPSPAEDHPGSSRQDRGGFDHRCDRHRLRPHQGRAVALAAGRCRAPDRP